MYKRSHNLLLLVVNSVGYWVYTISPVFNRVKIGQSLALYIYHHSTESGQSLYGFSSMEECDFFEHILKVNGVGPKLALSIVSSGSVSDILTAVHSGDVHFFTAINGVGKKTAQKILVELQGRNVVLDFSQQGQSHQKEGVSFELQGVYDALIGLGFEEKVIRDVLSSKPQEMEREEDILKYALQMLSR